MKFLYAILFLGLLYGCTSQSQKSKISGIEIETVKFNTQFIRIVGEYISCHPDYDSYLVASSYDVGHELNRDNIKKTSYFIMPSTRSYVIEYSPGHSVSYSINENDDLSFYIKVKGKIIYIKSDLDLLSSQRLRKDSIPTQQIITKKKGGEIWCVAYTDKDKFKIVSKDAENGFWPGIRIDAAPSSIEFHP